MSTWKEKRAYVAGAAIAAVAATIMTTGDIPEKPELDNALSLKGKTTVERVQAQAFERENAAVGEELTTLRTKTAKVHKRAGTNQYTAEIGAKPQHWFDPADSVWRDIDLTVREVHALAKLNPLRKCDKYVHAGTYRAGWKNDKPHDYIFIKDTTQLAYNALFDTSAALTVATTPQVDGIKQTITVGNAEAAATTLAWTLDTNADSFAIEDGAVVFRDGDGAFMFSITPPVVWDAKHYDIPAHYTLDGDTLTCTVDYPEDVVYPVTVDPTTHVSAVTGGFGRVRQVGASFADARNQATGDAVDTNVQDGFSASSGNMMARGFMIFNTAFLTSTDGIDSALIASVYGLDDYSLEACRNYLVNGTFTDSTLAVGWFNDFTGWAASGDYAVTPLGDSLLTTGHTTGDSIFIGLNAAGIADIDKDGYTRYALISKVDLLQDVPAAEALFWPVAAGATPKLRINYHTMLPVVAPTAVMTSVAGHVISLNVGANGNSAIAVYSIKITHPGGHQNYWSGTDTTATETWKLLATWGTPVYIDNRIAESSEYWLDVRAAELDTSAYRRIGVRAWNPKRYTRFGASRVWTAGAENKKTQWVDARGATSVDSISFNPAAGSTSIGSQLGFNNYRTAVEVVVPQMTAAAYCTLLVTLDSDGSTTDFNIQGFYGSWTRAENQKVAYYKFIEWVAALAPYNASGVYNMFDTYSTSGIPAQLKIPFTAHGLARVNVARGDTMSFVMLSSRDVAGNQPSGNEFITLKNTAADSLRIHAAYDSTEVTVGSFAVDPIDPDSIAVTWTNALNTNVALALVNALTLATVGDTLNQNATTVRIGGLDPNTKYAWKLKVIGGPSDATYSGADDAYTWPNMPGAPTVTSPSTDSLKVVIAVNSNPAATKFLMFAVTSAAETLLINRFTKKMQAITPFFVNGDSLKSTISANDSFWATYADFGGAGGITVGASPSKTYTVKTLAKSGI